MREALRDWLIREESSKVNLVIGLTRGVCAEAGPPPEIEGWGTSRSAQAGTPRSYLLMVQMGEDLKEPQQLTKKLLLYF